MGSKLAENQGSLSATCAVATMSQARAILSSLLAAHVDLSQLSTSTARATSLT